jgi:hypothetical protein
MRDLAIQSAIVGDFAYRVYPQILALEDRATACPGRPDALSVRISSFGAKTGQVIEPTAVNGEGGLTTWGANKPRDSLLKPMSEYASSFFK